VTIDSCHSHWVFDEARHRYRRVPQGPHLSTRLGQAAWQPYAELCLDPDSDSFVVVLNAAGTRMLRSWRHRQGRCAQCGAFQTEELSAEDVAIVDP